VVPSARVGVQPFDIDLSFGLQRFGAYDPTVRRERGLLRKAFDTADGPCVAEVRAEEDGVVVTAEGAGAEVAVADFAAALVQDDGHGAFAPESPLLSRLHRTHRGMRLVRVPWRFDLAAVAVLQQRVTTREAMQQWGLIVRKYGPRVGELRAFPSAERVARMASWQFQELGLDPKRARTMVVLARELVRRNTLAETDLALVRKRLLAVRGVGPWTTDMILGFAYGDPDALPLGDLHLPHLITWALARESPGSDARMVELLEPYRGHRFRIVRLLWIGAPKNPR
jgi:3-methyladenine DNA glycosylase/8-oxoguanine DNA glycosylase